MEDELKSGEELNPAEDQESAVINQNMVVDSGQDGKSFIQKIAENDKIKGLLRKILRWSIAVSAVIFLFVFFMYLVPLLQEIPSAGKEVLTNSHELKKEASYKKIINQLTRDVQRFSRKYNAYTTGQSYLVINTTDNIFHLYRNKKQIREGHCSTGSFKMLKTEEGKSWIFKTPKGKFWIQGKVTNPPWRRPDWAYVEEGLPIPSQDDPGRYEYGVLGDYAMALGDGYLIHGTIYKRFLGMPVTHGCVRLNDEDLKAIFNTLSIGSKVYIF
jgi:lipoprotein-anchoring transpeptidase ErfK/SrfK